MFFDLEDDSTPECDYCGYNLSSDDSEACASTGQSICAGCYAKGAHYSQDD